MKVNMKVLKISLTIIVLVGITIITILLFSKGIDPEPRQPSRPENQYTKRISDDIKSLKEMPDSIFCKPRYVEIGKRIGSWNDKFGETPSDNNKWKEYFTSDLYSVYVGKFINRAFFVFRKSTWDTTNLNLIRDEYQELRKTGLQSGLLKNGSPVDENFTRIQNIFQKYDEIKRFLFTYKDNLYSGLSLSARFSSSEVKSKISQAEKYRKGRLELGKESVNLCSRLQNELREIPQVLFKEHISYFDKKIEKLSGTYSNCDDQEKYIEGLYKPLKKEIETFKNDYNVANFDNEHERLLKKWEVDYTNAYFYFEIRPTIIEYLNGSELYPNELKKYKERKEISNIKGVSNNLKASIQLCLDFWELDGSDNKTYEVLYNKVDTSTDLKNSKLRNFLYKMSNIENPSYDNWIKRDGLRF